jgi:predicted ester cyclase
MSAEENKAIARRWVEEIWGKGNLAVVDEIVSPTFVSDGSPQSLEELKQRVRSLHANYSNARVTLEEQIAEGDKVVNRILGEGIYLGGEAGIPDTAKGKHLKAVVIDIFRIVNGKIEETQSCSKVLDN